MVFRAQIFTVQPEFSDLQASVNASVTVPKCVTESPSLRSAATVIPQLLQMLVSGSGSCPSYTVMVTSAR